MPEKHWFNQPISGRYLSWVQRKNKATSDIWLVQPMLDWQLPGELGGQGGQAGKRSTGCVCPPGVSATSTADLQTLYVCYCNVTHTNCVQALEERNQTEGDDDRTGDAVRHDDREHTQSPSVHRAVLKLVRLILQRDKITSGSETHSC